MEKQELRKLIKEKRNEKNIEELLLLSRGVYSNFIDSNLAKDKKNVLIYLSTSREVNTRDLIKDFFDKNINVYIPRVDSLKEGLMHFYKINSFDDLEKGCMGILEPKSFCKVLDESLIDNSFIEILPGLAFDKKGNRLGYGGGFYDRFNKRAPKSVLKLALSFDFAVFNEIKTSDFDVSVDFIITEKKIIDCKGN